APRALSGGVAWPRASRPPASSSFRASAHSGVWPPWSRSSNSSAVSPLLKSMGVTAMSAILARVSDLSRTKRHPPRPSSAAGGTCRCQPFTTSAVHDEQIDASRALDQLVVAVLTLGVERLSRQLHDQGAALLRQLLGARPHVIGTDTRRDLEVRHQRAAQTEPALVLMTSFCAVLLPSTSSSSSAASTNDSWSSCSRASATSFSHRSPSMPSGAPLSAALAFAGALAGVEDAAPAESEAPLPRNSAKMKASRSRWAPVVGLV